MSASESAAPRPWSGHFRAAFRLAAPVTVARVGVLILVSVDIAMSGHASTEDLAAYAVALAPMVPMLLLGIGLLSGVTVYAAKAAAAGELRETGQIWRVGLGQAWLYGLALLGVCSIGEPLLLALGQSEAMAASASDVLFWLGLGLPAALAFTVTSFFLESLQRAVPGVIVMFAANLLNAAGNWVFIYGELGMPALGAEGAAAVTSAVRWLSLLALVGYVRVRLDRGRHGLSGEIPERRSVARRLRAFGLPMGLSHAMESAAFATMTLFAGWLGPVAVAAYQATFNLIALSFMLALGYSSAASVHVAGALGRGVPQDAERAGWSATALAAGALLIAAAALVAFPEALLGLYTSDPRVLALGVPCVLVAAIVLCPDGIQATLMGALRGYADVWPALALYVVSFWLVMVPCGYLLGVHLGGGPVGLLQGTLFGVMVASVTMGVRFHILARRGAASLSVNTGSA